MLSQYYYRPQYRGYVANTTPIPPPPPSRQSHKHPVISAQVAYSPSQPEWKPPSGRPSRRRSRTWIWVVGTTTVSLATALVMAWFILSPRLQWEYSPYGYSIVETKTVSSQQVWSFTVPLQATPHSNRENYNLWKGVVDFYSDPQLTQEITFISSTTQSNWTGKKAVFKPFQLPVQASKNLVTQEEQFQVGNNGNWPAGTYYIVERRSILDNLLERPRVHIFQVDPSADQVGIVEPTMDVTGDGIPFFQWPKVENAVGYSIIKIDPRQGAVSKYEVIGNTDGDTDFWLGIGQDRDYQDNRQNGYTIESYNSDFQAWNRDGGKCTPQDKTYQGTNPPTDDDPALIYPSYAVVAVDASGNTSLPMALDGKDLISKLPLATATDTLKAITADADKASFPESYPVTMGDCHTAFFPTEATSLVTMVRQKSVVLTYSVTSTMLTDSVSIPSKEKAAAQLVKLGRKHHLRQTIQVGTMQDLSSMSYQAAEQYAQGQLVSAQTPDTPYDWNGSSAMVRYIAANMFAGNTAIDMSEFVIDPDSPLIYDAASEAVLQNPYLTDTFPIIGIVGNILYVDYEMETKAREKSAQRIKTEVDKVVDRIIEPGMSDRAKARVINEYVAKNAKYDQAALRFSKKSNLKREDFVKNFPHSWDAVGVLLDGVGVCASYALAFKALADAANLESVAITGYADDSGMLHEWIKVKIKDNWFMIDPTWNSNMWEQTSAGAETYFLLRDSEESRQQVNSFIVDAYLWDYDTK